MENEKEPEPEPGPRQPHAPIRSDISVGTRSAEAAGQYLYKRAKAAIQWIWRLFCSGWLSFWNLSATEKFTLGLLVAAVVQACITQNQLSAMREDFANSKTIASHQAKVSDAGLDLARTSYEADARAWMVLDTKEMTVEPCPPRVDSVVTIHFVNAGKSPARNLESNAHLAMMTPPLADPPPSHMTQEIPRDPSVSVIGPGMPYEQTIPMKAPEAVTRDATVMSQMRLYVWGVVTYQDGFSKTRHTRFCAEWTPSPVARKANFTFCDHWNDVD